MTARYALAEVAALLGEPTRAAIVLALMSGRALPAGELAREAGLSAAATSLHLARLTQGGLLAMQKEGRHRYYRLANSDVAHAVESLGVLATAPPVAARALSPERAALRTARTCYDHIAGTLAVALAKKLEGERILRADGERAYLVTSHGTAWLAATLGIDVASLAASKRPVARKCLDWTERRHHEAGALGASVLARMFEMRWAARVDDSRTLRITARGRRALTGLGLGDVLP